MLAPGTNIGRYLVQRKLAEGGMAEIYLASAIGAEGFAKDVVVKVVRSYLSSDEQFVQMFINEARLASRLNHANVVQIFDFGKHEQAYFLTMEYVRGASLWDLRKRCREYGVPFPPVLAAEICAQVARGLQYAHNLADGGVKLGVVHRDVTPHNVLLSFDGAVKLTDFGIAKATTSHTAPGVLKGKFAYMSPEQARGEKVDARTDLFALGIVLWELLTGGRLFDGDTDVAVLRAVQESLIAPPSRLNPDVHPDLSDIVMKALARNPAERFQTAFEFDRALSTYVLKNAQSVEDTAVGTFLQQMFREEFSAVTARKDLSGADPQQAQPADDFGVGNTAFVDRAKPAVAPTMTHTPVKAVPAQATPRPVKPPEPEPFSGPRTAAQPGLPGLKLGTDVVPKGKPGSASSRRFDPIPIEDVPPEPQPAERARASRGSMKVARGDVPTVEGAAAAALPLQLSQPFVPAPVDEAPERSEELVVPRSNTPLLAAGAAVLLLLVGAVAVYLNAGGGAGAPKVAVVDPPVVVKPAQPPPTPEPPKVEPPKPDPTPSQPVAKVEPAPPPPTAKPDPEPVVAKKVEPVPEPAKDPEVVDKPVTQPSVRVPPPPGPGPAAARATGTLAVRAIPFAIVYANGRELGEATGARSFKLPAGTYEVEFVKNKTRMKQRVVIKPNETSPLDFDATSGE